ncbi:MAG: NADP-dependent isocitrate dehydrogenase [Flavobacteriaceae bacterium]|jgi:isocitrate dehydrogenase|nr:NADP-dependent isocitrate dehydrogenase [Flavobacteriaceae bacterium]MBT4112419.1 NADP-dependent isocitrate dehydrogenase [Flavobacteriaceae bacterium]MBT4614273.1 NADP-dependent isocitrate dehydrogenase [Flavobacteriaceae bacterium]MBT5246726.1 NADP-dependent isocitrate dehydrogenase [Flavobacteriaceae bacterium]MBT5772369.1 NADP-dependent isocitrate dehydrogenase [Flavobacteriaceae bacterium]
MSKIIYTKTDEAPALATISFLPIVKAFTKSSKINTETRDVSLSSRILANFSENLKNNQIVEDDLKYLANLVNDINANIIKLPNISASIPQIKNAIKELQQLGYNIPEYPDDPVNNSEKGIKKKYDLITGSAVNPVLREGNSDRRVPNAVKNYAKRNPHSMGKWDKKSQTHVSTMKSGDFRNNEKSLTIKNKIDVCISHIDISGKEKILKDNLTIEGNEIIDASVLNKKDLLDFIENEIRDAKDNNLLLSIHLKATMMKVSDPILFGHVVKIFFKNIFQKYSKILNTIEVNPNDGIGVLLSKIESLDSKISKAIKKDINLAFEQGPYLAMVNSEKGISNLHVPSDIIIDASMPAMIRTSGKMWNRNNQMMDTKAIIPDSSYASIYKATIDFCKKNGAFNPELMGSVSNIGLMAKKAEEYGSHDKTFEIENNGYVNIKDTNGDTLIQQKVSKGDIWRMCQVKDEPIKNWVKLAVERGIATKDPVIFWLDNTRSHDIELIEKVHLYLKEHNLENLEIKILSPYDATNYTLERINAGKNTISVTGNVLRDYLTDLFPILEVGTSAKMLSIVPLMKGGRLFETGAGGSAPKHVEQLIEENHLRWDSLGEFLALEVSLDHLGKMFKNSNALVLSKCLGLAIEKLLMTNKSPSRKVGELDNRGSHYYLALYWSEALSIQNENIKLKEEFQEMHLLLNKNESTIIKELNENQGERVDLGGYYSTNIKNVEKIMRPSSTLNNIINTH